MPHSSVIQYIYEALPQYLRLPSTPMRRQDAGPSGTASGATHSQFLMPSVLVQNKTPQQRPTRSAISARGTLNRGYTRGKRVSFLPKSTSMPVSRRPSVMFDHGVKENTHLVTGSAQRRRGTAVRGSEPSHPGTYPRRSPLRRSVSAPTKPWLATMNMAHTPPTPSQPPPSPSFPGGNVSRAASIRSRKSFRTENENLADLMRPLLRSTNTQPPHSEIVTEGQPAIPKSVQLARSRTLPASQNPKLPPLKSWVSPKGQEKRSDDAIRRERPRRPPVNTKSSFAGAATTHTDLHVFALSPSLSSVEQNSIDVARDGDHAKVVQIIESPKSSYEIVWGEPSMSQDESRDASLSLSRSSSDSSEIYQTGSPNHGSAQGFHSVKRKLEALARAGDSVHGDREATGENGRLNLAHESGLDERKADMASTASRKQIGYPDDEDMLLVPPNSQYASQVSSSNHSCMEPSPSTPSDEGVDRDSTLESNVKVSTQSLQRNPFGLGTMSQTSAPVVDGHLPSDAARRLSSMVENRHFKSHRDSLTLARQRILHVSGVPLHLLRRHDSLEIARERLRSRRKAPPAATKTSRARRQVGAVGDLTPILDISSPA